MQIIQKISVPTIAITSIVLLAVGVMLFSTAAVSAGPGCTGIDCVKTGAGSVSTGTTQTTEQIVQTIVNVLLFIIGVVSVIMIVIGGIRYTTSNGDSNKVAAAKNTILYAVVGLVVAILAYAIVDFVIDAFIPDPSGADSSD